MSDYWIVVLLSVASALVFAVSTSLKHVSAGRVPDARHLDPRSLGRFLRATVSHPLWLAGIVCDAAGLVLQILALHRGALSVVQPLLLTSLVFALLIRGRVEHRRIGRREAMWALILTGDLSCFILLAHPVQAGGPAQPARAVIAAALGVVVVGTCLFFGRRLRAGGWRAAILGSAVGVIYAATAALIKAAGDIGARGVLDLLAGWQLYAVIVVGALGLVLSQLAFQAGPLTASLPATATADPLLSVVVGVFVYGETIRQGSVNVVLLSALLALLGVAVVQLSRSASGRSDDGSRPSPDSRYQPR